MRSYPTNSPQAAGRVLALLLIADGHVCRSEIQCLDEMRAEQRLGLPPGSMGVVMRELCEDLLLDAPPAGLGRGALRALIDEVTDPRLRAKVLELARAAAAADGYVADGEAALLAAADAPHGPHAAARAAPAASA